ncbi:aminotransferase class I/II-fold pyridoxal phosphate-dependent enzyme [Lutimonas saemankumensis]|uniref:DegT/DnrJ/EryC1/StrS family aminotransferase n=1 Tax=Lutimonas saemankumensis TaxID=483016 RepID=UPI001CD76DCD|nr:aminotransferase class I/II-fold pyridoxal phosphate-dependent enzyme [Lutimonas saemankumensis]MCA0931603.1 aminotransferase class I/II-fold pyridoxal phosphate-dependent enzyme [Lutimonas saemankumensis]
MKRDFDIYLSPSHLTGEEQKFIENAFDKNHISASGENLAGFESDLCQYLDISSCSLLNSGTSAIHLALILLGVKAGDEVLCSTFTYSATINPVRYQNAIPVLVDSERETWNMSPELLEKAIKDRITKGKKPKAIILVHLYGMPSKMNELIAIARKYEIPIIEDAAEALGSKYEDKYLGTFGELGIFSFNGNKIITTSGGGALVSDNPEYCKKANFLATQARDDAPHYQHSEIGYNYRMTNLAAGIGRGQMEVLDKRVKAKRETYNFYKSELAEFKDISFLEEPEGFYSNRWLTTILTDSYETREALRLALENENIESRPLWKPMHVQPVFKNFPASTDGSSEVLFNRGLCLPSGSDLTTKDLMRVVSVIKKVLKLRR